MSFYFNPDVGNNKWVNSRVLWSPFSVGWVLGRIHCPRTWFPRSS